MQQVLRSQGNESLGQLVGDAFAPEQARLGPLECSVCVGEALTGQLPQGRLRRIATWLDDGQLDSCCQLLLGELAEDPRRGRVHARHPLQVEHAP